LLGSPTLAAVWFGEVVVLGLLGCFGCAGCYSCNSERSTWQLCVFMLHRKYHFLWGWWTNTS